MAQNNSDVINYINTYKLISMQEMQRTGIPASIILAQGIHETEAGTSELVKKSNNHFGIKCKDNWTGSVVYHDDDARGECFRSYPSPLDSYKDHSDFLKSSPRYQFLFRLDPMNYEAWAYGLKKAGYATNIKYSQILIKLIRDYNLQQYTLIAMGRINPGDEMLAGPNQTKGILTIDSTSQPNEAPAAPVPVYPEGIFSINNTKVVYAKSGSSLLSIADQYEVSLPHLIDFNELQGEEILIRDQLLFLQRKRKTGLNEFHTIQSGETLYSIAQTEGIRLESLIELNLLSGLEMPAIGEKLYLQKKAPVKPAMTRMPVAAEQSVVRQDSAQTNQPTAITHIVQSRETLYSISKRYGVDVEKIQEWNKLDSMNLRKGQELIIYKN
jgi:LysM repeat protein